MSALPCRRGRNEYVWTPIHMPRLWWRELLTPLPVRARHRTRKRVGSSTPSTSTTATSTSEVCRAAQCGVRNRHVSSDRAGYRTGRGRGTVRSAHARTPAAVRDHLDRDVEPEIPRHVADREPAELTRSLEVADDHEVEVAQLVHVAASEAAECQHAPQRHPRAQRLDEPPQLAFCPLTRARSL